MSNLLRALSRKKLYISRGSGMSRDEILASLPTFSERLYVNGNNTVQGNGSIQNPFNTILRAYQRINNLGDFTDTVAYPPITSAKVIIYAYDGSNYDISVNILSDKPGVVWDFEEGAVVNITKTNTDSDSNNPENYWIKNTNDGENYFITGLGKFILPDSDVGIAFLYASSSPTITFQFKEISSLRSTPGDVTPIFKAVGTGSFGNHPKIILFGKDITILNEIRNKHFSIIEDVASVFLYDSYIYFSGSDNNVNLIKGSSGSSIYNPEVKRCLISSEVSGQNSYFNFNTGASISGMQVSDNIFMKHVGNLNIGLFDINNCTVSNPASFNFSNNQVRNNLTAAKPIFYTTTPKTVRAINNLSIMPLGTNVSTNEPSINYLNGQLNVSGITTARMLALNSSGNLTATAVPSVPYYSPINGTSDDTAAFSTYCAAQRAAGLPAFLYDPNGLGFVFTGMINTGEYCRIPWIGVSSSTGNNPPTVKFSGTNTILVGAGIKGVRFQLSASSVTTIQGYAVHSLVDVAEIFYMGTNATFNVELANLITGRIFCDTGYTGSVLNVKGRSRVICQNLDFNPLTSFINLWGDSVLETIWGDGLIRVGYNGTTAENNAKLRYNLWTSDAINIHGNDCLVETGGGTSNITVNVGANRTRIIGAATITNSGTGTVTL